MSRPDDLTIRKADHPSVYSLTDRQLAEEYRALTGYSIQVPSSRNPVAWWQWRSALQERVKRERLANRGLFFTH